MSMPNSTLKFPFILLGCAIIAQLALFTNLSLVLQTSAVLILTGLLPGWLLVEWLVGQSDAPPTWEEQLLYAIGVGYGVMVLGMLGISYWPGPVAAWQTALVFDGLLVILAGLVWRQRVVRMGQPSALRISHSAPLSRRWLLAGGLVLVLVGGFFRFTNLGYAEFLTDEARTVLRAAAVLQGHEDVLFIHRKGPVEILLPAVIDSLTGHLDEASARLPFAIASLTGLLAVFLLGWRLFNPLAGWIA
ncbi:MAG: hypothetical protein NT075_24730, partial [Chloroflexi bacterium]|nr:hypothetical protein [Chloroflexota bacterium]